jgi:hypothetical protein
VSFGQKKPPTLIGMSPDSTAFLAQGLVDLQKAVKCAAFYPEGHPYRTDSVRRTFGMLLGLLAERDLVLTVDRQGFLLDGDRVDGGPMALQLARECFIRRIVSITLMQDLLLADLDALIQLLSWDPQRTAAVGAFARQLQQAGVCTIWINEKDLAAVWAKRAGEVSAQKPNFESVPKPAVAASDSAADSSVADLLQLMALESGDQRYRELARELVEAVGRAGRELAILSVLEELLRQHEDRQKSASQRECAVFILRRLADGAADFLLSSLEDRDCLEKEAICRVLAALGGKGADWVIDRICVAQGIYQRKALATALVAIGPPAIEPAAAMLRDERWYVVRNMVSVLGELRASETVPALKRPLYHQDGRVRREAVRALMKIGGDPAQSMLIRILDEPDPGLVRHAILSLGTMRSKQALPALLTLLERRDLRMKGLDLKKELLVALGRIADRRATPLLLKLLGQRGWLALGRRLELKLAVASALGALGDLAALPSLAGFAAGSGALAEACRDAVGAIERVSGGIHD